MMLLLKLLVLATDIRRRLSFVVNGCYGSSHFECCWGCFSLLCNDASNSSTKPSAVRPRDRTTSLLTEQFSIPLSENAVAKANNSTIESLQSISRTGDCCSTGTQQLSLLIGIRLLLFLDETIRLLCNIQCSGGDVVVVSRCSFLRQGQQQYGAEEEVTRVCQPIICAAIASLGKGSAGV